MKQQEIDSIIRILKKEVKRWKTPAVGVVAEKSQNPFKVLISCLLSLRTKDTVTEAASIRLFKRASTPQTLLDLKLKEIEKLIYPVCFYRTKAL